jgi:Ni/Co efflux regulator RcnB
MSSRRWLVFCAAGLFALSGSAAFAAQGRGNGNGHNKHGDHDDDDRDRDRDGDRGRHGYNDHDRDEMRAWYRDHRGNLPPGLAKRDRLPPGLERQLVARGTLPPGLRKKYQLCPPELERQLPPPPPDCRHVVIGGSLVLLNVKSFVIVDVFHFEVR